jgi:hypothetical protein
MDAGLFRELVAARPRLRGAASEAGASEPVPSGAVPDRGRRETSGAATATVAVPARVRVLLEDVEHRWVRVARAARQKAGGAADVEAAARPLRARLATALTLDLPAVEASGPAGFGAFLGWLLVQPLGEAAAGVRDEARSREWLREWRWDRVLAATLQELDADPRGAALHLTLIEILIAHASAFRRAALEPALVGPALEAWLGDECVQRLLQVNQFDGTWWFHQEAWESLVGWWVDAAHLDIECDPALATPARPAQRRACRDLAARLVEAARDSGYRLDRMVARITS